VKNCLASVTTFLAHAIRAPLPQNKLLPLQALVPLAQKLPVHDACGKRSSAQHRSHIPFHVRCITCCYSCEISSTHRPPEIEGNLSLSSLYLSRLSNTYVDCLSFLFSLPVHLSLSHTHTLTHASKGGKGSIIKMGVPVMAKVCHAFLGMSKAIEGDLWQRIHNGSSKLWLPAITLFFFSLFGTCILFMGINQIIHCCR